MLEENWLQIINKCNKIKIEPILLNDRLVRTKGVQEVKTVNKFKFNFVRKISSYRRQTNSELKFSLNSANKIRIKRGQFDRSQSVTYTQKVTAEVKYT